MKKFRRAILAAGLCGVMLFPAGAAEHTAHGSLSAGYSGSTYVDSEGTLWAWGDGYTSTPVRIREGMECTASAVPGYPAMMVCRDGTFLYFAGGFFEDEGKTVMDRVQKTVSDHWNDSYYALDADGYLWGWGQNGYGALSPGKMALWETDNTMVKLMTRVVDFDALGGTVLALDEKGVLWSWGDDAFGKLGTGEAGDRIDENGYPYRPLRVQVLEDVKQFSMGVNNALAVKEDGTLWFWGLKETGLVTDEQCDQVDKFGQPYSSLPVLVMEEVLAAKASHGTTYIIKSDHSLWTCGSNGFGEAGVGNTEPVSVPTQIMEDVKQVVPGECFALVEKLDGTLWAFGYHGAGQLGIGAEADGESIIGPYQTTPRQILFPQVTPVTGTAYATTQTILINGTPVRFETYAVRNAEGNDTNYVKLRDLAYALNGTSAQFEVSWDGAVNLLTGTAYTPNGTEMFTPYSGDRDYTYSTSINTRIDGVGRPLTAMLLQDDDGNGYSYYQLRSLSSWLGFTVDWTEEKGIFIETE